LPITSSLPPKLGYIKFIGRFTPSLEILHSSVINILEDPRVGMKAMGWDDWLINTTLQLFELYRKGITSIIIS
jgi:hypothetical protein